MRRLAVLFFILVHLVSCGQEIQDAQLRQLIKTCEKGHSDGLVIYQKGKLVGEWYFGKDRQLVDVKSVTKSITNLAVGYLVTNGKLRIDQKVHEFYPEWNQENKQDITIRHLLTHTSGLLDSDFSLVETTPDIIQFALASDLTHPVGKFYVYNNKAINLLAGIIEKADGRKLDQLMKEEIFAPLGIEEFVWPKDKTGNPYVMAFLQLYPKDLAQIGLFVLNKGEWNGQQIIQASWFDESMKPGADFMPEYGLLWELVSDNFRFVVDDQQIDAMKELKVSSEIIAKAESMKGVYSGYRTYYGKLREVFGKDFESIFQKRLVPHGLTVGRKETDGILGYAGMGYLGQYLVIYPEEELVAVRGINQYEGYNWDTDEIPDFPRLIRQLKK